MSKFYENLKTVTKHRKEDRYVANRQWIVENVDTSQYKLVDNIKAVLIRVTPHRSVLFYLTRNMWKYGRQILLGTPQDCVNWIRKEQAREASGNSEY